MKLFAVFTLVFQLRIQSRFGHSLDEQEDRLRKLCEFKGYKMYKVYREEGVSAKNTNRPKF